MKDNNANKKRKGLNSNKVTTSKPKKPKAKIKKISESVYTTVDVPLYPPVDITFKNEAEVKEPTPTPTKEVETDTLVTQTKETSDWKVQRYSSKNESIYIIVAFLLGLCILGLMFV